jgi:hypothetical protein
MAKKKRIAITEFERWIIDYENGVTCKYTLQDGDLTEYSFVTHFGNKRVSLLHVTNIGDVVNSHWGDHHKVANISKFEDVNSLFNFTDFDNLFYMGQDIDGMTADRHGRYLSTPVLMDYIFFTSWMKIEKSKEKCQKILDSLDKSYIISADVIEIPWYNINERKNHHYSLSLIVKFPDDLYNSFLDGKSYVDDEVRVKMFESLRSNVKS